MKGLLGYAAVSGALGLANAKALKWSADYNERTWTPPQETLGYMPALGMNDIAKPPAPAPTSPPNLDAIGLHKRGRTDNTCGYIDGVETNSLWCPTSQFCAFNSINSHIGCCDDTATKGCNVWTTCIKSADASKYTTDNGLTLWCGFEEYPNCLTHIYAGTDNAAGYTLLGCGVAAGTDKIFVTPTQDSFATSSSIPSTTATATDDSSDSESTSSATPRKGDSSAPIGAIVGGVVGGVAALGLIGFGIFFLVHLNKKRNQNPPAAAAPLPAPGPQGPPPPPSTAGSPTTQAAQMTQHGGYYDPSGAGFAHLDPRASIAKPPYGFDQGISPPASPPPPSHSPGPMQNAQNATPSPPPPQAQGYPQQQQFSQQNGQFSPQGQHSPQTAYSQPGAYSPQQSPGGFAQQPPPQQQQYHPYHPPQHQFAAELPTDRGDGEVRELPA